MKSREMYIHVVFAVCLLLDPIATPAITFTSDTYIGPADFSSDGQDIIVSNCTLTVDGTHGFNSLQLLNGGVLTHSAFTNGIEVITNLVNNESQTLTTNNPATLVNLGIDTNTIAVMDTTSTITYTPNVDYLTTVSNGFTQLTLTANSSIASGATVLVSYDWLVADEPFLLTITNDLDVTSGAQVNVSGKGYAGGLGFGAGTNQTMNNLTAGGGGGHGGYGGMSSTFAPGGGASYDHITSPSQLGSGGGSGIASGGAGGGAGSFYITGTLQLDGQILADGLAGTNDNSGGGSGGSFNIYAQTFSGTGTISAQGGSGNLPNGGGGGGGMIAIEYATNSFTGNIVAYGGAGANYGGAGTIQTFSTLGNLGQLLIANNGVAGTNTPFSQSFAGDLVISGGAIAQPVKSQFTINNLFVGSNSMFLGPTLPLFLTVNGNATVESNASISADFLSASGSGAGTASCGAGSGGSYAGKGGNSICGSSSPTVNVIVNALDGVGSPGGGTPSAYGGGTIFLNIGGTLSLNGRISANGASSVATNGGGGSGGCIAVQGAGTIVGNGSITANGGAASNPFGGGGGGGAIAVTCSTNSFMGSITAYGGTGANGGGAGAVFIRSSSLAFAQLILDNDGLSGSITTAGASSSVSQLDLTVRNGAILSFGGGSGTFRDLFVGSNSLIMGVTNPFSGSTINATNATIQTGAGITLNGIISSTAGGPGQSLNLTGGGGGNAGCGGMSASNAVGGFPSGQRTISTVASGAPGGAGANGQGGFGGGNLKLNISGILQLDGFIAANGGTSASLNSGGGSGGGITLNVGTLTGAGTVSANGGAANNLGGGGGGGSIAILYLTNSFSGNITAYGGAGANYGGAGTIYQAQTATLGGTAISQQLLVDNGGAPIGTNTILSYSANPGAFDLTIRGGALLGNAVPGILSNGNLTIGSNSALIIGATPVFISVLTNATIQSGGAIRADGDLATGSASSSGQSLNSTGGGGGYGGVGGSSYLGAQGGGVPLDSFKSSTSAGSPGGRGASSSQGGNGGGGIKIIVNGTLQLDGLISAQGTTGPGTNSGGGSGGNLSVSAGTISGGGNISANGGAANGGGGGGGGGRIVLNYNTNSFTGSFTAYGGAGFQYGGAGTIYLNSSFSGAGQFTGITVDNGGNSGQSTLLNGQALSALSDCKSIHGGILGFTNPIETFPKPIFGNLLIGSNSALLLNPYSSMVIQTNATIQPGGSISTSTAFLYGVADSGQGANFTGGGGGHGGFGGFGLQPPPPLIVESGGSVTDSVVSPTLSGGSGGPNLYGGPGGGPIHLIVNGILQLDGVCSVDGAIGNSSGATNYGGGAGGAIWLQAGQFLGAGTISANGASGTIRGGGGGGGRIAIWANNNLFSGTISARGGIGKQNGGPGTIYFNSNTNGNGPSSKLLVDNAGNSNSATAGILSPVNGVDVVVTNGGNLAVGVTGNMMWNSLTINSNSSLTLASNFMSLNLTVNSNLIIQPTAAIDIDGQGFSGGVGSGAGGVFSVWTDGGGGHGGMGSAGTNTALARGGISYDSITAPIAPGGCGGGSTPGSAGGGALELTVNGLLQVDGAISANGQIGGPPQSPYAGGGGGAGGSLWLTAGTFSGAGSISANGGNGVITNSGGGGGGRIAIYFNSNTFTGTFSAHGGNGVLMPGGAGTILTQSNSALVGQLSLDNGGAPGTNTPLDSLTQALSLSISNGAAASSGVPLTLQSLSIGSNAFFTANSQQSLSLTVLGNAFVDTNGAIFANSTGYDPGAGPGSGSVDSGFNGSGGGYGGVGGNSILGTAGGSTYGSSNQPTDFGSAGGVSNSPVGFSQGGGAIRLVVDGALTVNGNVAANGNNASINNSAGGSGGSIWLTAQSLAGNGSFTANGGSGRTGQGGGGGGGRIAIYADTNSFFGSAAATGGTGAFAGQPGTIVIATNLFVSGSVTDTNGVAISGVNLQPSGLAAVTTDINGAYSVPAPLFWTGTVAPTTAGYYLPSLRAYSSLTSNAPNQNYLATVPTAFNINSSSFDGTNLNFSWYGINGVTYQPLYSSNLLNWLPYGPLFIGSNAPASVALPVSSAPQLFFRLGVSY